MNHQEQRMHQAIILAKQDYKKKDIAQILDVSERTVWNYLNGRGPKPGHRKRKASKLDSFKPFIDSILKTNPHFNNEVLLRKLQSQGYEGSISILRDYTRTYRNKLQKEVVFRFETEPGYQAQMDWKELPREGWGHLKAFVMLLGYSRKPYIQFVRDMKSSTFLGCQNRAFEYFEGVPQTILYDNMKTAWVQSGGEWTVNSRLLQQASHYGFEPHRCQVRTPQTKGKVERLIRFLSDNFLAEAELEGWKDLDELNSRVTSWLEEVGHRELKDFQESREERFSREKNQLLPLPPQAFDYRDRIETAVSREALISFQGNKYSVPPRFAGKSVSISYDPLENICDVLEENEVLRTFHPYPKGARRTFIWKEDEFNLYGIWADQKKPHKPKKSPKKKTESQVSVSVRNPQYYDRFMTGTAS